MKKQRKRKPKVGRKHVPQAGTTGSATGRSGQTKTYSHTKRNERTARTSTIRPTDGSSKNTSDEHASFSMLVLSFILMTFAVAGGHIKPDPLKLRMPIVAGHEIRPAIETQLASPVITSSFDPILHLKDAAQVTDEVAPPLLSVAADLTLVDVDSQLARSVRSPPPEMIKKKPAQLLPLRPTAEYEDIEPVQVCEAQPGKGRDAHALTRYVSHRPQTSANFGVRLAEVARMQTEEFVIYNDKYRALSYPLGDVAPLFGVCTDVVIRAYRAMGIDLQVLVQQARVGKGDSSIDHRRTETLRRFFTRHAEQLPVTRFADDYLPGDIVTYHRPQNTRARSHIAIVSDRIGPSGQPMILHNRGWGPQLEDALFVDQITGHYRYAGPNGETSEARIYNPHIPPSLNLEAATPASFASGSRNALK